MAKLRQLHKDRAELPLHFTGEFGKKRYKWFRPTSLNHALDLLHTHYRSPFDPMLVAGYTSTGIFKRWISKQDDPQTMIDISGLTKLQKLSLSATELVVGAGVTYQEMHIFLTSSSQTDTSHDVKVRTIVLYL